jgi:hypothetical protein
MDERAEVMQALLELDCMPAGMELFPAANDDQWTWITKVIDESDYYIVLIGGHYGSVSAITGQSYTEMEYRYAVDAGSLSSRSFTRIQPLSRHQERNPPKTSARGYRSFAHSQRRDCASTGDLQPILAQRVSRSLTQLIKQYPAVGWLRASHLTSPVSAEEVLRLSERKEARAAPSLNGIPLDGDS